MHDAGCRILDAGWRMQDGGWRFQVSGFGGQSNTFVVITYVNCILGIFCGFYFGCMDISV